ncbi:MAG: protein kinase [Myxococcota bacterium]
MSEPLPSHIGPHRVTGLLGQGGMGKVYRAETPDGQPVAVKVMRQDLESLDPSILARFEREAMIRVDHPNVVQVLDAGTVDATPYIAFELLEGESLAGRLQRRGVLPPQEVVALLRQIAAGLEAAHAMDIVHRDLKPGNVFCCADGTVKLLDFGIALLAERTKLTMTGTILGTPAYLSPEQISQRRAIDPRSDLWALGVIAYEALSGRLPFQKDAAYAVLMGVLLEEPAPLDTVAPGLAPDLTALVHACLSKNPDERPASAAALSEALARFEAPALDASPSRPLPAHSLSTDALRLVALLVARSVTNPARVEAILRDHGGRPVPMGDELLGVFGLEGWRGDEVHRAVNAGLAIRPLADAVGIGAGRARSDAGGTGVSGEAVDAAFLASFADVDGVAVERGAASAVRSSHVMRAADAEPDVLEVLSAAVEGAASGDRPMLGRDDELARLQQLWGEVEAARGPALVLLRGPIGVGKTRLRREFQDWVTERGVAVLGARGDPDHRVRFLWMLGQVIRRDAALARPDAPPLEALRGRVLELLREDAPGLDSAALLGELLGLVASDTVQIEQVDRDPRLMGDLVRLTVEDFLAAALSQQPSVLFLEDAQHADQATLDVVEGLADQLRCPALVVIVARDDAELSLERFELWPRFEVIDLAPLEAPTAERFATSVAPDASPTAIARVVERAEGNPLFIEQMLLALPVGDATADQLPLPVTVEAAVQERLEALPEDEREACRRASVFDRHFDAAGLAALGLDEAGALLMRLADAAVLELREPSPGQSVFAFRSDLVRDVAGRMLGDEARRALHHQAASYLAAAGGDPAEVAGHFDAAGRAGEAARWYVRAAMDAKARGDLATVLQCTDRALKLEPEADELFELHFMQAEALGFTGRRAEQGEQLALAMAAEVTPLQRVRARMEYAYFLLHTGRVREGLAGAQAAVREARRLEGVPRVLARAHLHQGEALVHAGRTEQAHAAFTRAEAALEGLEAPSERGLVTSFRARLHTVEGDLGAALRARQEAQEHFRRALDRNRQAANQVNIADLLNRHGRYAEAVEELRSAATLCRRTGNRLAEPYARANLGYALVQLGRIGEAFNELDVAEASARKVANDHLLAYVQLYRARGLRQSGRADEARSLALALAEELVAQGQATVAALAKAVAGRAALDLGSGDQALELTAAAVDLLDGPAGVEEDQPAIYLARIEALRAAGDDEAADALQTTARTWIRAAADRIGDAGLRKSFLEQVPENVTLLAAR